MQDIQLAIQVYFIGIIIATIMAGVIRAMQVIIGRMAQEKKETVDE